MACATTKERVDHALVQNAVHDLDVEDIVVFVGHVALIVEFGRTLTLVGHREILP
jgi:hypothetical protein